MKGTPLLATIMLVVLAGCLVPGLHGEPEWSLKIDDVDETPHSDGIEIDAEVTFGGNPDEGARVEGVRVCALDGNGTVLDQTAIGTITYDTYETNTTLITPHQPSTIVLDYSSVDTDDEFYATGNNTYCY